MKVAVFGSTGPTGQLVIKEALAEGHEVIAFARTPSKLKVFSNDIRIIEGELSNTDAIETALQGSDAVISLLGPGTEKFEGQPVTDGTARILEAMIKYNVRRLIASSTPSSKDPHDGFSPIFAFFIFMVKSFMRPAYNDIVGSARLIRESDRDWTILRLPMLNDKKPTGKLIVGYLGKDGVKTTLSRKDLAAFIISQLNGSQFIRQAPAISNV